MKSYAPMTRLGFFSISESRIAGTAVREERRRGERVENEAEGRYMYISIMAGAVIEIVFGLGKQMGDLMFV